MEEKRDREGFIFYQSFYKSIEKLPKINRQELYEAIIKYSFDLEEPVLKGVSEVVWILIKPQLEANNRRYENGKRPKQKGSKNEANCKQNISENEAKEKEKEKEKDNVKDKDKEIIISSKEDTTKALTIKKEYGDKDINVIVDTIKRFNNGIIDGTVNENRRYGKLLKDKISGINGFNGDYKWFISNLIQKTDKFHISKTTSCEKMYYNLAVLIKSIQANNIQEKQKEAKIYSY